ncbi:DUF1289 domain-containing protein [Roseinatronobacter alkalisoli]|uniref:DUF1289 domain-containing protein n=1 Tax=Roseinatronobacter alkalisoli TaxID=3028235 RepID=A0ABT5T357_9RHOB|nr:DUF1289 domain-containing protein [Roseinatronobacter sp. HJB301]MDD7969553.1 DUF1289 domain-containing protein [Roseinatronobacter sp. HJB301]
MSDAVWKRNEIESPCIKICVIHPQSGLCAGCLRTLDEISAWTQMSPQERQDIMAKLPARQVQIGKRRGGRTARAKANPDRT